MVKVTQLVIIISPLTGYAHVSGTLSIPEPCFYHHHLTGSTDVEWVLQCEFNPILNSQEEEMIKSRTGQ